MAGAALPATVIGKPFPWAMLFGCLEQGTVALRSLRWGILRSACEHLVLGN